MEKYYEKEINEIPENNSHMVFMKIQHIQNKLDKISTKKIKKSNFTTSNRYDTKMYIIILVVIALLDSIPRFYSGRVSNYVDAAGAALMLPFSGLMFILFIYFSYKLIRNLLDKEKLNKINSSSSNSNSDDYIEEQISFYNKELERLHGMIENK